MDRNLALNLVRVTEVAAIRASYELGRGDKEKADQAGVDGMRSMFNELDMIGTVVIGEGEMDEAPMLYIGEKVGKGVEGQTPEVDIAVDPVDGTTLVASGRPNAITVLAVAPKGCLLHAPDMYMQKLVAGPECVGVVGIDKTVEENIKAVAKAKNKEVSDVVVAVLDRPRHKHIIDEARKVGARIKLFSAGDIAMALATCFEDANVDIMLGTGGAPEGVISAAAIKAMGGVIEARLVPQNEEQKRRCKDMGIEDINHILFMEDLVKGDECIFSATGITDGDFLKGVKFLPDSKVKTNSLVLRAETGTIRFVEAIHDLNKKPEYVLNKQRDN